MFGSKKESADANHWREKYLAENELFEQQQKSQEDYIHLLQRVLVRVSLAADGRDVALDKALKNLRGLLRKATPSKKQLSDELATIEALVRNLDEQRDSSSDQGMIALKDLVQQLLNLNGLSKSNKATLSKFVKQLNSSKGISDQHTGLLAEYARLQQLVIDDRLSAASPQETRDKGFFSRLFDSSEAEANSATQKTEFDNSAASTNYSPQPSGNVGAPENVGTPENADAPEIEDTPTHEHQGDELSQRPSTDVKTNSDSPDSPNLDNIRSSLSNLIEKLIEDKSDKADALDLLDELNRLTSAAELEPTLHKLADFIAQFVTRMQQDFENFLYALEKQILGINDSLTQGSAAEESWRGANSQFDEQVRQQVGAISDEAEQATDIATFKHSVQQHISRITTSMDELLEAERARQVEADKQLQAMTEKLSLMENETGAIKKRLKAEQIKASTDVLTKLPNREALDERVLLEWERFKRYKNPVCLVVLDIDHFKRVNDQYGHLVGDKVLQAISKELTKSIRETDFVARFGGEEFVILLPETNLEEAEIAMNNIREKIAALKLKFINENEPVTASFGITAFTLGNSIETLFTQADKALYQAKEKGRNQVICYQ